MSDAPAAPAVSAPGLAPGEGLLKFLAIGRLAMNAEGELLPEKHRLVAHNFARKGDPDPEWSKQVKSHLKAVMKRAGHKLAPGKRIRLKDDQDHYEVHILTDEVQGDKTKTLVFFAVTAVDFPKYHSVPVLLKDLKAGFFQTVDAGTLWNGGSVQRACQSYFTRLTDHYASSPLSAVQGKVDRVRDVMSNSVSKALTSVEALEDMDEKAELFEDKSKTFYKRSEQVKVLERGNYRKLTCLLCLAIVGIVAYLVISAIQKYKTNNDSSSDGGGTTTPTYYSSSSSGPDYSYSSSGSSSGNFFSSSSSSSGIDSSSSGIDDSSSSSGPAAARRLLGLHARRLLARISGGGGGGGGAASGSS